MAVLLARLTTEPTVMGGAADLEADDELWVERSVEAEEVVEDDRADKREDETAD